MQEFDKQFNKPVDNVILDRPTGTSEAPRKDTSDEERTPRFSKKQKLIGGFTAAALAAGLAVGFGVAANGDKPAESPANTSEPFEPAPVDPIEEPGAGEEEPTSGEVVGFSPELTPEETAKRFVELQNEWINAGINEDTYSRALEYSGTLTEFAKEEAAKNTSEYATAMFGPDWAAKHADAVAGFESTNAQAIAGWVGTETEPVRFEMKAVLDEIQETSTDDEPVSATVSFTYAHNAAETSMAERAPELLSFGNTTTTTRVEFIDENGSRYIDQFFVE